jgi:hypothetical protein
MRTLFIVVALTGALSAEAQMRGGGGGAPGPGDCPPMQRGAPEPLTLAGLAVGAGVLGVARWRSRKRS